MKISILGRYAFAVGAAAALLSACAGSSPGAMPTGLNNSVRAPAGSKTFTYTGAEQTFKVPTGVTSIAVDATGAVGGRGLGKKPSFGGRTQATIPVTPAETLYVFVGGKGQPAASTAVQTAAAAAPAATLRWRRRLRCAAGRRWPE